MKKLSVESHLWRKRGFTHLALLLISLLFCSSLLAQHQNPAKQKEHHAAMHLIHDMMITHTVVRSGLWTNPKTWEDEKLPGPLAVISIPEGKKLTVDVKSDTAFRAMRVDGTLYFAPTRDVRLVIETIIVRTKGSFLIASEDNPVEPDHLVEIIFTAPGPIDREWDPTQVSRGLVIHGKTGIFGSQKEGFTNIKGGITKGNDTLTLTTIPIGWKKDDEVNITGLNEIGWGWKTNVGHVYFGTEDEIRTIKEINGNTITLDKPVEFNHLPIHPNMPVPIANFTRNVQFRTQNPETLPASQRAHTMFMHNIDAKIYYAGFYDLGRTDKSVPLDHLLREDPSNRNSPLVKDKDGNVLPGAMNNIPGRYPVHFHRAGVHVPDGSIAGRMPAILKGNALMRSPGWGYVNHESHVEMINNVSFDVFGAHLVSEDGDELGSFIDNYGAKSQGDNSGHKDGTTGHDLGHTGSFLWIEARNLKKVEGNVAAGMSDAGIHYFHRHTKEGEVSVHVDALVRQNEKEIAKGRTRVAYNDAPLMAVNNTVIASGKWGHVTKAHPEQGHELRNIFDGVYAYNVVRGIHLEYTGKYTIKNFAIYSDPIRENFQGDGIGFTLRNNTRDVALWKGIIHGFAVGISTGINFNNNPEDISDTLIVDVTDSSNGTFINTLNSYTGKYVANNYDHIKILTGDQLVPGRLQFTPDDSLQVPQPTVGHWWNDSTEIPGTLVDSAGSVKETLNFHNSYLRNVLMPGGHFTRQDNSKFIYVKYFVADRLTGETLPLLGTFELAGNPGGPDLGSGPALPTFTIQPADTEAAIGKHLTLHCKGTNPGYYYIHYQWARNGVDIPGAHYPDYTIHRVAKDDLNTQYSCTISNLAGSVTSEQAKIYLLPPKSPTGLRVQ